MQYISINELNQFDFHDAFIIEFSNKDNEIKFCLSDLNVSVNNVHNMYDKDMCIKKAELIFENARIIEIVACSYKIYQENILQKIVPAKPLKYDNQNCFLKEGLEGEYIYGLEEETEIETKTVTINTNFNSEVYDIKLSFSRVVIRWEEFDGLAWYEKRKH